MSTNNVSALAAVKAAALVAAQGAVTALSFSAFSSSLGTLIGSSSMAELPSKAKPTRLGLQDLRIQFGNAIVDKALQDVGPNGSILDISEAVDKEFQASLHLQFTDYEVNTAIAVCAPGDMRGVWEIAQGLHDNNQAQVRPIANSAQPATAISQPAPVVKKKSGLAGYHPPTPTIDTLTGIKYESRNKAAFAIAPEYNFSTKDASGKAVGHLAYELERLPGYPKGRLQSIAFYEANKTAVTQ
jgi:hypothetical protein